MPVRLVAAAAVLAALAACNSPTLHQDRPGGSDAPGFRNSAPVLHQNRPGGTDVPGR